MNLFEQVQNMSEEEKAQLLATDFGADLEKEASAEVAKAGLAEALYAYGAHMAELDIEGQGDLSKEASESYNEATAEISQVLEGCLVESGILETDDTTELHKEAQAAAAIMFQGYADQMEDMIKVAAEGNDPSFMAKMKGHLSNFGKRVGEAKEKTKEFAGKAGKHIAANKGKYGVGAGAAALGLGALAYKKHHEKKASELSVEELSDIVNQENEFNSVVFEGLDKLAAKGKAKAVAGMGAKLKEMAKKHYASGKKHVSANKGKYGLGAGAALGAIGTHAARKMSDKD